MRNLDLGLLEKTFALMEKYCIDEVQCEEFTVKKTKFKGQKVPPTDKELLEKHLQPLPTEPWNDLSQEQVDNWSKGNR